MIILGYDHEEMFPAPVIWHPSIQVPSALTLHWCLQVVYSIRLGAKAVLHPQQVTSSPQGHHGEANNRPAVALTPTDYSELPVSPVCRSLDGGMRPEQQDKIHSDAGK